jgi:peptide/nickel transport system permease protein
VLRNAIRRLLWILPTLIGISIVTFLFLSYVPDPTADPTIAATLSADKIAELRRERDLDLPRFFNFSPVGVEERAARAMDAIADSAPDADAARRELVHLGGAALPYVLPRLDSFSPERRAKVALALAPVARRMGAIGEDEALDPARAAAFWDHLWSDRSSEFRRVTVRSAVQRLARYGSSSRASELLELDTFALEDVLISLAPPTDDASLFRARALIEIAAHVTGRDDRIAANDSREAAAACVERWKHYWAVYRSDFVSLSSSAARLKALILETRYGKWLIGFAQHRLGRLSGGGAVLDELAARAPVTLAILFGAITIAYVVGVALGAVGGVLHGRRVDLAITCAVLALYAIPTAVLAVAARSRIGIDVHAFAFATVTLALGLIALPAGQQRSALASALAEDHVMAARARGASRLRAAVVHGLRNALLPVLTLMTLEAPMALGGAFVVERVFGLRGIGEQTIRAVQERDVAWLMAISLVAAGMSSVLVVLTDVAYALLDHRMADVLATRRARV